MESEEWRNGEKNRNENGCYISKKFAYCVAGPSLTKDRMISEKALRKKGKTKKKRQKQHKLNSDIIVSHRSVERRNDKNETSVLPSRCPSRQRAVAGFMCYVNHVADLYWALYA